jgi:soluble lytic murein transglycosylase-like protein
MNITSDLQAVSDRIAQIMGNPATVAQAPAGDDSVTYTPSFASLVQAAIAEQSYPAVEMSGETPDAAAPVAPEQIDRLVGANAAAWNVDPSLIKAIIANESGFDANATSNAGAQGLMQLMPGTAAGLGVNDSYDPAQNVAGGTRYLRGLLDRFGGNLELAVAAYNAGPGAVERYGGVPPYAETRNYVQNVLSSYEKYRTQDIF